MRTIGHYLPVGMLLPLRPFAMSNCAAMPIEGSTACSSTVGV